MSGTSSDKGQFLSKANLSWFEWYLKIVCSNAYNFYCNYYKTQRKIIPGDIGRYNKKMSGKSSDKGQFLSKANLSWLEWYLKIACSNECNFLLQLIKNIDKNNSCEDNSKVVRGCLVGTRS